MQNLSAVIKQVETSEKRIVGMLRIVALVAIGSAMIHLALFLETRCLI